MKSKIIIALIFILALPPISFAVPITESFNTSDSDTLGPDLTWTEIVGDVDVVSNAAVAQTAGANLVQAESALATDDHYAKAIHYLSGGSTVDTGCGTIVRKHATAGTQDYYHGRIRLNISNNTGVDRLQMYKVVGGTFTQLGTDQTITEALPDDIYTSADGSTIYSTFNSGAASVSVTDTAITGNLLTGFRCTVNGTQKTVIDAFEIDVIGGGGGGATLKTVDGVALANVKTINGIAIANVKTVDGMTTS